MTTSVIDPFTKEKLAYPNIGKIRVKGTDVRDKEFFVYTEVNNRYYTGFNYNDLENISAVFSGMASKSFDILLSRLLTEMPSSAQVLAFRNDQATLDRGRNAGILNKETMILFRYEMGFVEPIAVAEVKPSKNSSIAHIIRWKNSDEADKLKKHQPIRFFVFQMNKKYLQSLLACLKTLSPRGYKHVSSIRCSWFPNEQFRFC
ncbi:hypothetical protein [Psychrosphaera algicola]|uniref:Uncharacterized protein n=1 Tax=Psychrosphaera algicola TaxID=3023714 RepID=A0ABT5FEV0_9GAMM|nr:hypothetical protein [Psychrosphaera sp. G1-22]MDC2889131.1 hypothetical protein [Psychrosphaera sp. G1-22]